MSKILRIFPQSISPRISLPAANIGEIPGKIALDFGRRDFASRDSHLQSQRLLGPILLPSENLGEIRGRILATFSRSVISLPGEHLAGIPPRFKPGLKIPAGSPPISRQDPAKIPVLVLQGYNHLITIQ